MAILTFVYVVTTVVIAYVMMRSNHLSRNNIAQTLKVEKQRSRPYVMFDLQVRGFNTFAILKNYGTTGAYDVTVSVEPKLQYTIHRQPRVCGLTVQPFGHLVPGREVIEMVDGDENFSKLYPKPKFNVQVTYSDIAGEKYEDTYAITFDPPAGKIVILSDREKIVRQLDEIKHELTEIRNVLKDVGRFQHKP